MSELEDLNAKAARLWLEFMQAQAKAAAAVANKLPEVTRSLVAEAGVPLAAEMSRWIEGALPPMAAEHAPPDEASHEAEMQPAARVVAASEGPSRAAPLLTRANHRRLKTPKSMSRRRTRRS